MKRKWLLVMISIMTAIVLAACGTSDKKEGGSSDAGTDKEEGGGEFRIGMEAATHRSTGHSKTMQMAQ